MAQKQGVFELTALAAKPCGMDMSETPVQDFADEIDKIGGIVAISRSDDEVFRLTCAAPDALRFTVFAMTMDELASKARAQYEVCKSAKARRLSSEPAGGGTG